MTVSELLRAFAGAMPQVEGAPSIGVDSLASTCSGVTHDSRAVVPGSVFVALKGLKADGEAFAPQAIAAGAAVVVAEHPSTTTSPVPWVVVPDARLALALLAAEFFGHPSRQMQVVGITGTNGKTTTELSGAARSSKRPASSAG